MTCLHYTPDYLLRCAEGEGGRAILAIQGYANAHTAAYFAREAAHYARLYLDAIEATRPRREYPQCHRCGCDVRQCVCTFGAE